MASVTQRIKMIKQPRGGYIKPSMFKTINLDSSKQLNDEENISPAIIGMAVDYMTRFMTGTEKEDAFRISLEGAEIAAAFASALGKPDALKISEKLLEDIKGLDDQSVINTCKLVTFDAWWRNLVGAMMSKGYDEINPDTKTVQNIKIMVERSMAFWKEYGPVTVDGFTFETKGYTETVDSGDGDYLTADTLWDFKVSKSKPTNKHTLQLLMYWIMGKHSEKPEYKNITKLGIFNPRLNIVYILNISDIPQNTIKTVEKEVICYE